MNIIYRIGLIFLVLGASPSGLKGQIRVKINGLYALAGVINPAVEARITPHSALQGEVVISPWQSIRYQGVGCPMLFGMLSGGYRYYFEPDGGGWYAGADVGIATFHMTRPIWHGTFGLKNTSAKGYGYLGGVNVGYVWIKGRWLLDLFAGFGYLNSHYNAYALVDGLYDGGHLYNRGEIILTPHRSVQPAHPDPFNGSGEWLPYKIGLSIGIQINRPRQSAGQDER